MLTEALKIGRARPISLWAFLEVYADVLKIGSTWILPEKIASYFWMLSS